MKFIILTDTHFVPGNGELYGLRPKERLQQAIDVINREHLNADFVLITGDLANLGEVDAYQSLKETLSSLQLPYHLMVGNHDRWAAMMQVFPEAQLDQDGHLQFVIQANTPIVCLDTLDEGVHDGWICEKRLAWLDHQLGQIAGDYILALHHPPFPVGIPSMDQISLRNPDQLWAVIQDRKPVQMLMGHIHRPIGGVWRGIPLHIQRATNHQVAFDEHKIERIPGSSEAPDFSKVIVSEDTLLIHQISYQASQISYYLN